MKMNSIINIFQQKLLSILKETSVPSTMAKIYNILSPHAVLMKDVIFLFFLFFKFSTIPTVTKCTSRLFFFLKTKTQTINYYGRSKFVYEFTPYTFYGMG